MAFPKNKTDRVITAPASPLQRLQRDFFVKRGRILMCCGALKDVVKNRLIITLLDSEIRKLDAEYALQREQLLLTYTPKPKKRKEVLTNG